MSEFAAKVETTVRKILDAIADVYVQEIPPKRVRVIVTLKSTGKMMVEEFVHGMGYDATARTWAQRVFKDHTEG